MAKSDEFPTQLPDIMKLKKPIESLILTLRGQKIILDADLAEIYGVETRALNQAVKRNQDRFPDDFLFELTRDEILRISQTVTSGTAGTPASLKSQIVISNPGRGGRRSLPLAFTEHGALMAANVLNSTEAVEMSVFVIRAFMRAREHLSANSAILKRLAEIDKTLLQHDSALRDVYRKLLPMLQPPPEPPKRRIGFNRDTE
jgi:hypothetical protein